MIAFADRISISREEADAGIFDEGIASAIAKEKSTADDFLGGEKRQKQCKRKASQEKGERKNNYEKEETHTVNDKKITRDKNKNLDKKITKN